MTLVSFCEKKNPYFKRSYYPRSKISKWPFFAKVLLFASVKIIIIQNKVMINLKFINAQKGHEINKTKFNLVGRYLAFNFVREKWDDLKK